jgi:hypothetical protein
MRLTAAGANGDTAAVDGGATIIVTNGDISRVVIPGLGIDVATGFSGTSGVALPDGRRLNLFIATTADGGGFLGDDPGYLGYGDWSVTSPSDNTRTEGTFITGFQTSPANMPRTGAGYEGWTEGNVYVPGGSASYSGQALLNANFATGAVTGTMTGHTSDGTGNTAIWNASALTASITSDTSRFSGTVRVTSSPGSPFALQPTATGFVDGGFYGPGAGEIGAVWSLSDGSRTAVGTFTGKR